MLHQQSAATAPVFCIQDALQVDKMAESVNAVLFT